MLQIPLEADVHPIRKPDPMSTQSARKQTFGQLTKEPNVLRFERPKSCLIRLYGYRHCVEENLNLFRRLQANLNM